MNLTEDRSHVRTRLGVNMVVEAGAGTGKTTLLIERLCFALLAQGITAPRLVALTFTEKAAAEIKTRLVFKLQSVVQAIREHKQDPVLNVLLTHFGVPEADIVSRAESALSQLDRSQIGTIHSFCSDILRSYPLEAGLTPNAEIDTGVRAKRIFEAYWNKFLDEELGVQAPRACLWKEVLQKVSLTDLYDWAREMCSGKIQQYDYFAQRKQLVQVCQKRAIQARNLSHIHLEEKKKPRVIERALEQAAERFEQAAQWLQNNTLTELTQETILITSVPKDWEAEEVEEAKALCRFAAQANPHVQQLVLKAYGLLENLTGQVRSQYAAEGILSFDDLIVKTRDLLKQNLLVRRLLQEKYDVFYIDEFQDTDPVQGELILFLAEQKGRGATDWKDVHLEAGKLFVVGDPKQSIYRFRGADITAYELFTDLILRQGGEKFYLRQNFRSECEIIELANQVCSAVMKEKPAFQPAYEPIFTEKTKQFGAAELALIARAEVKAHADDYRHNQAEYVAQWIKQHVGKTTLQNGQTMTYQDIVILSRAATTLGPYTDALRRHGIPFSIEEDRDFYKHQEIADLLNFLRVLENPRNRIALVGVMRSPLGAMSDEEVYQAAQRKELDFRTTSSLPALERLFGILRHFYARVGKLPLHQLLREILQETFLAESCILAYEGERSWGNLERLVSLAEGYSLQNATTLGQFLSRIEDLMGQEGSRLTTQSEGELQQAVSVMTVHKSKGLEFPVVILVDISKKDTASATKRPAHLYSWRYQLHGLRVGPYADINLAWLEEEQQLHARCEEIRVLYVALTRARERLLLVGNEVSDVFTMAEMFKQAGCWPELSAHSAEISSSMRLIQVPYMAAEKFIYLSQEVAPPATTQWNLAAWRDGYAKRMQTYQSYQQVPQRTAPSHQQGDKALDQQAVWIGDRIHEILARQNRYRQETLETSWRIVTAKYTVSQQQAVWQIISHFDESALAHQLSQWNVLGAELPFSMQTDLGMIQGVIDVLLEDKEGTVWVVDYKTDIVIPGTETQRAQLYRAQLNYYQQAARQLYPEHAIQIAIVFVRTATWIPLAI